jgi:APA family basic amino acid/polyamine antiporter
VTKARAQLLQVLGVGFGIAVIIGNTIGGGIMRAPGEVAAEVRDPLLFGGVWVLGGLYALLGALSVAELATMVPRSGGQYVFAHRAIGPYAGFVVGWTDWFATCGSSAAVAILVAEYSAQFFPALKPQLTLVASAVVVALALAQWRGVKWGSALQNVTSMLKALAFIALVLACFLVSSPAPETVARVVATPAAAPHSLALGLVLAFQAVIFTYDGWTGVIYFSEELRDPPRQIPRAMFGGVLAVMAIYLLVNLALVHVLSLEGMAGETLAAGRAASQIFGERADDVIRALTIVSMFASINAFHLMAARVLFAMSRDGLFSSSAVRVNSGGTPTVALALGTVVTVVFIASGTFEKVVAVLAFFFVVAYALSFISLFILRRREPELPRPFRVPGYPWTTLLALAGSLVFLVSAVAGDPDTSLVALLVLAASYPAYRIIRKVST